MADPYEPHYEHVVDQGMGQIGPDPVPDPIDTDAIRRAHTESPVFWSRETLALCDEVERLRRENKFLRAEHDYLRELLDVYNDIPDIAKQHGGQAPSPTFPPFPRVLP